MPVLPSIVEQIRRELNEAPRGHKTTVARRWAEVLGVSVQQVYRLVEEKTGEKARKSEKLRPEYYVWTPVIFQVKKHPPEGAGEISTDQAVALAAMWGKVPEEAKEVPPGTFDRIARELGLSKKEKRRNRYQASRPNLAHHFDASSSKFLYIHRRVGGDFVLRLHRPGAGTQGYKNKPVPCDRLRPWVYGVVDDHSGRLICRYTAALGESMADALLFLQHAWSEMGLPEILLADQGVLKKGLASQDLIKRLDVAMPEMLPFAKEAHGKIERPWRTLWQRFEKVLFAGEWAQFEMTLTELNARLAVFLEEDYNRMAHRFEKKITRMQAWRRISLHGGIVAIPENALATAVKRKKRTVGVDGTLQYEGNMYEVKGLHAAEVYVFEGVFSDRLVVQEVATGKKYEVEKFRALELGEYRAHPETPHQKAVKEGETLRAGNTPMLYATPAEKDERIVEMPIRETARAIEDPFDVTRFPSVKEAYSEVISIAGTSFTEDERRAIEELIASNNLDRDYVRNLALELRAEIEIRRASAY